MTSIFSGRLASGAAGGQVSELGDSRAACSSPWRLQPEWLSGTRKVVLPLILAGVRPGGSRVPRPSNEGTPSLYGEGDSSQFPLRALSSGHVISWMDEAAAWPYGAGGRTAFAEGLYRSF